MSRGRQVLLTLIAMAIAFGGGFGWQYLRALRLQRELQTTREQLSMERLQNTISEATVQAQLGSYETARQLASDFYTQLQQRVLQQEQRGGALPDSTQVNAILGQRDATITLLSRSDAGAAQALASQLQQFRAATSASHGAAPLPGTSSPTAPAAAQGTAAPQGLKPAAKPSIDTTHPDTMARDTGGL
jgi:hypothetical protein